MGTFKFDATNAALDSNDPDYYTFDEIMEVFKAVDSSASRRMIDTVDDDTGLEIVDGELGRLRGVVLRADPKTGEFTFTYTPAQNNPWRRHEARLREIYKDYVVDLEKQEAMKRGRDVRGLAEALRGSKEGVPGLNPDVEAHIGSFLTGKKGSVSQQVETLKKEAKVGTGRRKTKKRVTKKRRTTRRR
jgi:hypothetical protein